MELTRLSMALCDPLYWRQHCSLMCLRLYRRSLLDVKLNGTVNLILYWRIQRSPEYAFISR